MKKVLVSLFAICIASLCSAQADTIAYHRLKGFLNRFTIGFPVFHVNYYVPFKSDKVAALPYGINYLLYDVQPSVTSLGGDFFSFRLLALYYRDKIGIQCTYSRYGAHISESSDAEYSAYLAKEHSGYNTNVSIADYYKFSGLRLGLSYRVALQRKIVLEPMLQMGFETYNPGYPLIKAMMREYSSNQFILLQADGEVMRQPHSYEAGLNLGRTLDFRKSKYHGEFGAHASYMMAPYDARIIITEKPYGMPQTVRQVEFKEVLRAVSFGLYLQFYWKS